MPDIFAGAVGKTLEADLLTRTVEGRESSLSYALIDGVPAMSAQGVKLGACVNTQLLIDFLRSERPFERDLRGWLADMLDSKKPTNANLTLSRTRGKPQSNMLRYVEAVEAYIDQRDSGDGYDAAVAHVVGETNIAEGTLKKAIARLEDGIKTHRETQRNP